MTQRQRRKDRRKREGGREGERERGGSNNLMFKFYLVYILMYVALLEK